MIFPRSLPRFKFFRWIFLVVISFSLSLVFSLPSPGQTAENDGIFCEVRTDTIEGSDQGRSYGDPHINTYDGFHYSFQTLGEYILSKTSDRSFEIQARQEAVPDRHNLSLNTAVAMNVCGDRLGIYVNGDQTLVWLNGMPLVAPSETTVLEHQGQFQRLSDDDYGIIWPSGDQVRVNTITVTGDRFLNIMASLHPEHRNQVAGLFGNFNQNPDDDLMARGGSVIPARSTYSVATNALDRLLPAVIPVNRLETAYFDSLYRQFGDSWRVRREESLFDYGPGQSPEQFTDLEFPRSTFTLDQASPETMENAIATCEEAGVEEELLDGCVFDVAATGNNGFAQAALNAVTETLSREVQNRLREEVEKFVPRIPFF